MVGRKKEGEGIMSAEKWNVGMVEFNMASEISKDGFILSLPCEEGRVV